MTHFTGCFGKTTGVHDQTDPVNESTKPIREPATMNTATSALADPAAPKIKARTSFWPKLIVLLLFAGYAGLYFCRSNLALAKEPIAREFASVGITTDSVARIGSIGVMVYAVGKVINGTLGDFVGGRVIFLASLSSSVLFTLLFLFSPNLASGWESQGLLLLFIISFSLNRFVQSAGWSGLVKIATQWFDYHSYGRVMSILCMSYLFGDFLARQVLSRTLTEDGGWRLMFAVAAGVLASITLLNFLLLKAKPSDVGLPPVEVSPQNLYGQQGNQDRPESLFDLLKPYLSSIAFWLVLFLSATLTYLRESLNFFNNDYLRAAADLSAQKAAEYSSFFPLFGALAVFLSGFVTDRYADGKRGLLMAISLGLLVPVLAAMAFVPSIQGTIWPVVLTCAVGFLAMAPYAFLSGAISMDLGGKKGSSTAAGTIDAFGYAVGAVIGLEAQKYLVTSKDMAGWRPFFAVMVALMVLSSLACVAYWFIHERDRTRAS
jgi:OPA family glycerol-3-phosphate transporter-like MFS transporter